MLRTLADQIDRFTDFLGRIVSWSILLMVGITFLVVVLRYLFNLGWVWMQESVIYLHGALFMLTAGYGLLHGSHVRVDLLYQKFSPRQQGLVDFLGALFLLTPFCGLILWQGWEFVGQSWSVFEGSAESGGIPATYLFKSLVLALPTLLLIQGLSQMIRSLICMVENP